MESPLLRLPQELLIRVASHLTTPELGLLRRVCKDVESRLFESFAYEFFHKRQFMVEEPSLQALIDISNHPTLSKRLTEVILSTAKYEEAEYVHSTTAQRLYMRGQTNNNILVSSGQARDMLLEAFNNLPNLRRVGLRDYDGKGRFRDGHDAAWKTYGHSLAEGEMMRSHSPDQTWVLLLQAVAMSSAQVTSVEVFLRHARRLTEGSFDVLSSRMSKTIAPMLARLETLMLTIEPECTYSDRLSPMQDRDLRLKKFLQHMPALKRLRLNFDEDTNSMLDWLAQSPPSPSLRTPLIFAQPLALAHLTTLDIGMVKVDPANLLKVLTRFELKTFNLWRVTLSVPDRASIKNEDEPTAATKFLDKLANSQSVRLVERAMLGILRINGRSDGRHRAYDVDFPPVGSVSRKQPPQGTSLQLKHQTMHFSLGGLAPNFSVWAKEMAQRAVVFRQYRGRAVSDTPTHFSDDSEMDEDIDEDEEEEGEEDGEEEEEDEEE